MKFRYLLLMIVIVGGLLRVYRIDQKGFWLDEMLTLLRITEGFAVEGTVKGTPIVPSARLDAEVITIPTQQIWAVNPWALSPPFYYFLLKGWISLVGGGDGAVRSLSALLSILTIPIGFLVARQLGGLAAGLIMAMLLATSPINLYYAQENRNYALLILLVLLSYYGLLRFRNGPDRVGQAIYTLATAAALYTHYFACWILVAQALYVVLQKDRKFAAQWITSALVSGILFLPWVPRALVEWAYGPKQLWLYEQQPSWTLLLKAMALPAFQPFSSGFFLTYQIMLKIAHRLLLQFAGFALGWIMVRRKFPETIALLGSWMFVPIAALLVLDLMTGSNFLKFTRYTVMINPAVYLMLSLAVIVPAKRWSMLLLCLLLAVNINGMARYYKQSYKVSEWKETAAYINAKTGRGDLILIYNPSPGYDWVLPSSLALLARYLPFQERSFILVDESCRPQAITQANPWDHLAVLTAYSQVLPAWVTELYIARDQATFSGIGTVWILQKRNRHGSSPLNRS